MSDLPDRPLTFDQLQQLGVSRATQRRLVCDGALRRVVRGVYVRADVEDTPELRAAALALVLPAHSVVCDRTAAWLWGIDCLDPLEGASEHRIEVVATRGHDRSRRSGVLAGERDLADDEICEIGGIRVTTPVRTACDLACLRGRSSALAVYDAFARHFGLTSVDYARQLRRFAGRRGVKQARELAAYAIAEAESTGESWTRMAIIDAGLPAPSAQVWVVLAGLGPARLDLGYEELKVAIEYDGEEFHSTPEQREHDEERRAALCAEGWVVVVVRKDDFTPRRVAEWTGEVREALRERRPAPYTRIYSRGESYRGPRR